MLLGCRLRAVTRGVASEDGRTVLTESVVATAPLPLVDLSRPTDEDRARTHLPGTAVGTCIQGPHSRVMLTFVTLMP